ncbi:L,D-transpeptidase family protein [Polyangium sorediatum]|uniref:L,D-transpeptidase family protein n=1 Tax=Polyangium sorediatum TaxID=889274 RepID=A0ABT6NLD0_9BACT|nr:L,D-transpeptidase family protein [Polyangium sorediatum]MDI1429108.1 L,D-transpeptidase family protein [Polyangium sorediatum]
MPRPRPLPKRPILLAALVLAAVALLVLFLPPSSLAKPASCEKPAIVVRKKDAALDLHCGEKLFHTFSATFGAQPVGQKEREGDERTPEGVYRITSKSESERFHRFLGISYPEPVDLARAKKNGIDKPGGGIGIHGTKRKLAALARAWIRLSSATGLGQVWGPTDGCIGLANEDVDVLYALVPVGTKVTIKP